MARRRLCLLALVIASAAGGCGSGADSSTEGSTEQAPAEASPGAVAALDPSDLPVDEASLLQVLEEMPAELIGRAKQHSGGDVVYRAEGMPDVFVSAMESGDVGIGTESNRELLDTEAQAPGRKVTDRNTDSGGDLLYIRGTEGEPPEIVHFMAWATPDGAFLFAAGADTAEHLDAVVTAFAEAAASG